MAEAIPQTLNFGEFHLPPEVDLLYRGQAVVPLEPRAVQVLRYLAEQRGRVVSKEDLLEHVWSDVFTTDAVLKKAISQIRQALGDDARQARFIETHHRRGYRFVAAVCVSSVGAAVTIREGVSQERHERPPNNLPAPLTSARADPAARPSTG